MFSFFYVYFSDYPGFQLNEAVGLRQGAESGCQGGKRREFAGKKKEEEKLRGGSGAKKRGDLSAETSSFFRLAWIDSIAWIQRGTKRENRGKEKEHPQVRLLNHILFAIDIFLGHYNHVMMYSFLVLHVKFCLRVI